MAASQGGGIFKPLCLVAWLVGLWGDLCVQVGFFYSFFLRMVDGVEEVEL